ncbi:hypothetical protein PPACK8108_LOCUS8831 [Phakopsora pachyrhizi]|uniref:Uncharacterized protein n=1 Tax=Phakopsora pachyrhizi TaxID=170000 RepID=A0AAV0AYR1_PHAPC|nr:hypothetical protein PPACK8108_LOCUS8831 [Phakopsora pachyrhizi]
MALTASHSQHLCHLENWNQSYKWSCDCYGEKTALIQVGDTMIKKIKDDLSAKLEGYKLWMRMRPEKRLADDGNDSGGENDEDGVYEACCQPGYDTQGTLPA